MSEPVVVVQAPEPGDLLESKAPQSDAVAAAEASVALAGVVAAAAETQAAETISEAVQEITEAKTELELLREEMSWLRQDQEKTRLMLQDQMTVIEMQAAQMAALQQPQELLTPPTSEAVAVETVAGVPLVEPEATAQTVTENVADALPVVVTKEPRQKPGAKIRLI